MYLIIIFIILVCYIIGLFTLNKFYKKSNHYTNQFIDSQKFPPHKKGLQVINLGSNQPKFAFDYSNTDIKGDNWAVGPQTFEYDFSILKKFHSFLAQQGVVVIPICLFSFFLYRKENRITHYKYYTFLDRDLIVNPSNKEYQKELKYPLLSHPLRIRYLLKDIPKDTRLEWKENPLKAKEELEKDSKRWIECWNKEFNINIDNLKLSKKNKDDIQANINILHEMLQFCIDRSYRPIIALLPVTEYLSNKLPTNFIEDYILTYINEANTFNIPVMNYIKDTRFINPNLYINSFFFNKKGRILFTETFINDLKSKEFIC